LAVHHRAGEFLKIAVTAVTDELGHQENSESEMLRRDCDEDSPRDEIEYWKTRSARLNLLQHQLGSEQVSLVIQCLHLNRSKLIRRWTEAQRKLTQSCHESNNNTLYLNDFEHHCRTLYVWDPVGSRTFSFGSSADSAFANCRSASFLVLTTC
jgi:Dynein heavy chain, N-terminal region 1